MTSVRAINVVNCTDRESGEREREREREGERAREREMRKIQTYSEDSRTTDDWTSTNGKKKKKQCVHKTLPGLVANVAQCNVFEVPFCPPGVASIAADCIS